MCKVKGRIRETCLESYSTIGLIIIVIIGSKGKREIRFNWTVQKELRRR